MLPFLEAGGRQVLLDTSARGSDRRRRGHCATHTAWCPRSSPTADFDDDRLSGDAKTHAHARVCGRTDAVEHVRQAYHRITPNLVQYYGMVEAIPP
ncbi:hypothetical protein GS584_23305 [Rhodococcus hoagii]|nr:hypothetical protein [Prescottella equi]